MWTAIALSRDVPKGVTRAVILDGREIVIWRSESGAAQVWEDRCPHRGMRLSFGFVRGETLNCLYHGWQYGTSASCQKIPAHPDLTVPRTIRANAYASAETGGFILVSLDAEPGPPPVLLAGRPIASLSIATVPERIENLVAGTPLDSVQGMGAAIDGVSVNLGWHVAGPERLMLHAVAVDPGSVESRVLVALHRLRADAERKDAA
jgi:nitrite reductase/ring-hydroxylating ferredoxin subunit